MCVSECVWWTDARADATMLWALLAVLALTLARANTLAIDDEENHEFLRKTIDTCPDVGYFFERTLIKQPDGSTTEQCFLCFCKEDNTAACWKRENRRCDFDSIYAMAPKPGRRRHKRSPWSLGNWVFADAIKNMFGGNLMPPEVCTPYEGSYSEGCPPADWCTGCTVCDCDAHGQWDCHILSFCPDDGKKPTPSPLSKRKNHSRRHLINGPGPISSKRIITTRKPIPKPTSRPKRQKPLPTALANFPEQVVNMMPAHWKRLLANKKMMNKPRQMNSMNIPNNKVKVDKPNKPVKSDAFKRKENTKKTVKIDTTTEYPIQTKIGSRRQQIEALLAGADQRTKEIIHGYLKTLRKTKDTKRTMLMKVLQSKFKNKPCTIHPSKSDPNTNILQSDLSKKSQNNKRIQRYAIKNMLIKTPAKPKPRSEFPTKWTEQQWRNWVRSRNRRSKRAISSNEPSDPTNNSIAENTEKDLFSTTPIYIVSKYETVKSTIGDGYYKYIVKQNSADIKDNTTFPKNDQETISTDKYIKYSVDTEEHTKKTTLKLLHANSNKTNNNSDVGTKEPHLVHNSMKNTSNGHIIKNISNSNNITILISQPMIDKLNSSNIVNFSHNNFHEVKSQEIESSSKRTGSTVKTIKPKYDLRKKSKEPIKKCNDKLRNILSKIASKFDKHNINNSTKNIKQKKNNFVFNYLKKFLHKLLSRRRGRKMPRIKSKKKVILKKISIIKILCKYYGPCKVTGEKKHQLTPKIRELNKETRKIFNSIKIIKGLLLLINFNKKDPNVIGYIHPDDALRRMNETEKLRAILSGSYIEHVMDKPNTELTQVKYIKENTQTVVESVSNFARILNEIINILTKKSESDEDILYRIKHGKRQPSKDSTLAKIKNWLRNKNKLIKKVLESIENSANGTKGMDKANDTISHNSVSIEKYAQKIIENLRSLQSLAKSKPPGYGSRVKRQAVEEGDIYQFMLLLMEYLLRQNVHLDRTPANDGIDLLIEAIRTAPDVQTIKKKVTNYKRMNPNKYQPRNAGQYSTVRVKFLKHHNSNNREDGRISNTRYKYFKNNYNAMQSLPIDTEETEITNIEMNNRPYSGENKANMFKQEILEDKVIREIETDIIKEKSTYESDNVSGNELVKIIESDSKNKSSTDNKKNISSSDDVSKNESSRDIEKMIESISGEITDDIELPFSINKTFHVDELTTARAVDSATENKKPSLLLNWDNISTGGNWDDDVQEAAAARKFMKIANATIPKRTTTTPASINIPTTEDVSVLSKESSYRSPGDIEWLHLKLTPEELLRIKNMDMMNSLDYDIKQFDDEEAKGHQLTDIYF